MITDYPCRKLRKVTGQKRPGHLLFLDTETKVAKAEIGFDGGIIKSGWDKVFYKDATEVIEQHRLRLGWTCDCRYRKDKGVYGDKWYFWENTERLCKYIACIAERDKPLHVFGHNIYFDLQASDFFYYFTLWGWILDFIYDKGQVYILIIRKGRQRIKCISTTNYFPEKLEVVGEFLGLPKIGIDFDKATKAELSKHCRRDTLIVRKLMSHYLAFIDKHQLGKFALAKGGQSLSCYRYRFMDNPIYPHSNETVKELEQAAYMGARTECRFLGKVKGNSFIGLDVNGLYPFVMKNNLYPYHLVEYQNVSNLEYLDNVLGSFAVIGKVSIDTDEPAYAVRYKHKIVFPTGHFTTYLCSAGLRYALEHNHITGIEELAVYQKADLFSSHIDYFANLKEQYSKENNKIMRHFAKDMANSLYGKFAQRRKIMEANYQIDYKGYYREEIYDTVMRQTEITTKMFNRIWVTYGSELCPNSFVAISAHVTEFARFYLYELMKKVGVVNVLYTDTDSLKIHSKYLPKLKQYISPYKLGMLKIEDRFSEFEILGAKHYRTNHELRIKGVPDSAVKVGKYKYKYTSFMKQATHLRSQITRFYITKPMIKTVEPFYDKGKVLPDGTIEPFHFRQF